jgi:hypothetical protein
MTIIRIITFIIIIIIIAIIAVIIIVAIIIIQIIIITIIVIITIIISIIVIVVIISSPIVMVIIVITIIIILIIVITIIAIIITIITIVIIIAIRLRRLRPYGRTRLWNKNFLSRTTVWEVHISEQTGRAIVKLEFRRPMLSPANRRYCLGKTGLNIHSVHWTAEFQRYDVAAMLLAVPGSSFSGCADTHAHGQSSDPMIDRCAKRSRQRRSTGERTRRS